MSVERAATPGATGATIRSRGPSWWRPPQKVAMPAMAGLRGLACLPVMIFHVGSVTRVTVQPGTVAEWLTPFGLGAVVLFFWMSGFFITQPIFKGYLAGKPKPPAKPFLAQRALRVFPMYWFILIGAVIIGGTEPVKLWQWPLLLTLTQTLVGQSLFNSGLVVSWTLSVDVVFYLLVPVLLRALYRATKPDATEADRLRLLLRSQLVCLLITGVLASLVLGFGGDASGQVTILFGALPLLGVALTVGSICGTLYNADLTPPAVKTLTRWPVVCVLFALECFWVLTKVGLPLGLEGARHMGSLSEYGVICLIGVTILLAPAILRPNDRTLYHRILGSVPLQWLGELSFGIYLWHIPILHILVQRNLSLFGDKSAYWPTLAKVFGITLCLAIPSYYLVERPVRNYAQRTFGWRRSIAGSGPVSVADSGSVASA